MLATLNSSMVSITKADASTSAATTVLDGVAQPGAQSSAAESRFEDVLAKGAVIAKDASQSESDSFGTAVINKPDAQTAEQEIDAEQWLLNALDQQSVTIQVRDTYEQVRDTHEQLRDTYEQLRDTHDQAFDTVNAQEQLNSATEQALLSDVQIPVDIIAANLRALSTPISQSTSVTKSDGADETLRSATAVDFSAARVNEGRASPSVSPSANESANDNTNDSTAKPTTLSVAEKYLAASPAVTLWVNRSAAGAEPVVADSMQKNIESAAMATESSALTTLLADTSVERAASSVNASAVNGAIAGIGEKTVSENGALAALKLPSAEAKWGEQLLHTLRDQVQVQLQQRIQNATIRLDPPELGSLEIFLSHESGRLNVHINASQPDVARLLQQTSDRLRHELGGGQFTQVNVQTSADGQSGQQHSRHNGQGLSGDEIIQTAIQANMQTNGRPIIDKARFQTAQSSDVLITV